LGVIGTRDVGIRVPPPAESANRGKMTGGKTRHALRRPYSRSGHLLIQSRAEKWLRVAVPASLAHGEMHASSKMAVIRHERKRATGQPAFTK
jgi:hypothetical protein